MFLGSAAFTKVSRTKRSVALPALHCFAESENSTLQTWVDVSRPAALRSIAGDILELAVLLASRTGIGRRGRSEQKAATAAFPVGEPATRAEGYRGWFGKSRPAIRALFLLGHVLSSSEMIYH